MEPKFVIEENKLPKRTAFPQDVKPRVEPELIPTPDPAREGVVRQQIQRGMNVPPEYVEISLSSNGRLSVPAVVHVRDYTGEDSLRLAAMNSENTLEILLRVVKGMVYEDIDPYLLHEEDLKEILLNVHKIYWSPTIENYLFPVTDEEFDALPESRRKDLQAGREFLYTDIDLGKISTQVLPANVAEPIVISREGVSVEFRFPRVGDVVFAERYVKEHYAFEEERFAKVVAQLRLIERTGNEEIEEISPEDKEAYLTYADQRDNFLVAVIQSQLIVGYKDKPVDSIAEKIECYKTIPVQFWTKLNEVIEKTIFGVESEVEMVSPLDKSIVRRRAQFQSMDFIPRNSISRLDNFDVGFGRQ